jgi:hypothetical protein
VADLCVASAAVQASRRLCRRFAYNLTDNSNEAVKLEILSKQAAGDEIRSGCAFLFSPNMMTAPARVQPIFSSLTIIVAQSVYEETDRIQWVDLELQMFCLLDPKLE